MLLDNVVLALCHFLYGHKLKFLYTFSIPAAHCSQLADLF